MKTDLFKSRRFAMGTLVVSSVLLFSTLFVVGGCADRQHDAMSLDPYVNYENPLKEIGELHNSGLDFVINEIKSTQSTRSASEIDLFSAIERFIKETFPDIPEEQMVVVYKNLPLAVNSVRSSTRSSLDVSATENQKIFLAQLDVIMSDDDEDIQSLRQRIVNLENEAANLLTEAELNPILAGTAVAYYTLGYWQNNAIEWDHSERMTRAAFSWKQLGKADVGGAFEAAAGGGTAWLLGCGPIGWKAWTALVVGGAVGASIWEAVDQLW